MYTFYSYVLFSAAKLQSLIPEKTVKPKFRLVEIFLPLTEGELWYLQYLYEGGQAFATNPRIALEAFLAWKNEQDQKAAREKEKMYQNFGSTPSPLSATPIDEPTASKLKAIAEEKQVEAIQKELGGEPDPTTSEISHPCMIIDDDPPERTTRTSTLNAIGVETPSSENNVTIPQVPSKESEAVTSSVLTSIGQKHPKKLKQVRFVDEAQSCSTTCTRCAIEENGELCTRCLSQRYSQSRAKIQDLQLQREHEKTEKDSSKSTSLWEVITGTGARLIHTVGKAKILQRKQKYEVNRQNYHQDYMQRTSSEDEVREEVTNEECSTDKDEAIKEDDYAGSNPTSTPKLLDHSSEDYDLSNVPQITLKEKLKQWHSNAKGNNSKSATGSM